MTDSLVRRVVLRDLDLSINGVTAAQARAIADALPGAINRAIARGGVAQNAPLTQTDAAPAAIAERLAGEIAGRVHAGLRAKGGTT